MSDTPADSAPSAQGWLATTALRFATWVGLGAMSWGFVSWLGVVFAGSGYSRWIEHLAG